MIIERFEGEKHLPELLKVKYLVPDHVPFGEIVNIIRRKLQLHPSQGFFLLVNGDTMVSNATLIGDLYIKSKHFDGYLYLTYVSHDIFGGLH
ncbi:MAP1LC3A [Cordylochernes scorpioides]|uniref:MAP1LC3A n=1 Tax=Cordylochernes scorpioides TaxID=51811 RepID=A0ABY6LVA0_9ARAC|nr:MAP1LC3A [Cordylochernes scorpioides]